MDYILLGQRIRHYRHQKRLTQEKLAEKVDVSTSFMGHIERGTRVASIDTLMKICIALEVTPNDLLGDELTIAQACLPAQVTISPAALLQNIALLLQGQENP